MMNPQNRRKLIAWSPHNPTNFVVGSNDLRLYEIKFKHGYKSAAALNFAMEYTPSTDDMPEEPKKTISLRSTNSEVQNPRCLSWCPDEYDPNLIAVGLPNGRAVLASFTSVHRISKEFVPRHSRSCNAIAWNPFYKNQLATGLDKVRGDFSSLVFDIHQPGTGIGKTYGKNQVDMEHTIEGGGMGFSVGGAGEGGVGATETVVTPVAELLNSETTLALAWLPGSPSCLAVGTGVKWLRIYDLRGDLSAPKSVMAHGKAVTGVCFDYFEQHRFATSSEDGVVKIWDMRKLENPTLVINTGTKAIQQIDWCPTRSGVLATIFKDSSSIKLWDVKEVSDTTKKQAELGRSSKSQVTNDNLSSFAWHPQNECRMLAITNAGQVEALSLNDNIPLRWAAGGSLSFSYGTHVIATQEVSDDISELMRKRVLEGYSANMESNRQITLKDKDLNFLWSWALNVSAIMKKSRMNALKPDQTQNDFDYPGVYSILFDSDPATADETVDKSKNFPVYKSAQRVSCQQICGWGFSSKSGLDAALTKLEKEGEFEKAATLAMFHLDQRRAILALTRGVTDGNVGPEREVNLKLVSLALAGFTDTRVDSESSLWRDTCAPMARSYKHPYLQACFGFLCSTDPKELVGMIDASAISLCDKIAFACRFLAYNDLCAFVERQALAAVDDGNLEGIVLTGLTSRGVDLMQNYVNLTGDVQTGCLAFLQVVPGTFKDARVSRWLASYRDLLDTWRLWNERAQLDILRAGFEPAPRPQVFARCNFCNQSLSFNSIVPGSLGRTARPIGKAKDTPSTKHKISGCPGCKKPLPRCSLCLITMNCTLPGFDHRKNDDSKNNPDAEGSVSSPKAAWRTGSNAFDEWFTWCQTCRHGGHARHLMDWFSAHDVCPVSDCKCRCNTL